MQPVGLEELTLDLEAWQQELARRRPEMIRYRQERRVRLGDLMVLDFEDRETVRWQVNRMLGVDGTTDPDHVRHELAAYNLLVPGPGELSATLLIGIDDVHELQRWRALLFGINDRLVLTVDGEPARLVPDPDPGTSEDGPPMVQHLRWVLTDEQAAAVREDGTVRVGVDHPSYAIELAAPAPLRAALPSLIG